MLIVLLMAKPIKDAASEDIGREAEMAERALRILRDLRERRGETTPRCIS
jgi:hypothetical protein